MAQRDKKGLIERANRYMAKLITEVDGWANRPEINFDPFSSNYPRTTEEEHGNGGFPEDGRKFDTEVNHEQDNENDYEKKYEKETRDSGSTNLIGKTYADLNGVMNEIIHKSEQISKKFDNIMDNLNNADNDTKIELDKMSRKLYSDLEKVNDIFLIMNKMLSDVDNTREIEDREQFKKEREFKQIDKENEDLENEEF